MVDLLGGGGEALTGEVAVEVVDEAFGMEGVHAALVAGGGVVEGGLQLAEEASQVLQEADLSGDAGHDGVWVGGGGRRRGWIDDFDFGALDGVFEAFVVATLELVAVGAGEKGDRIGQDLPGQGERAFLSIGVFGVGFAQVVTFGVFVVHGLSWKSARRNPTSSLPFAGFWLWLC